MNKLTPSKALVIIALSNNKTSDLKLISVSKIRKVRVKATTKKLLAKAVYTKA
jgi:hypothetical protein